MKKAVLGRLRTALGIILGRKCYYMAFSWNPPDECVFKSTAYSASADYFKLLYADGAEYLARIEMLRAVLNADNSIIVQWKDNGECRVSYDCKSEDEFNELRNQEID